ncbi:MAG: hypothetical protein HFJ27_00730 [Clostridia bacterium]|nr:hypothetical protein [Clostridia bacterium]
MKIKKIFKKLLLIIFAILLLVMLTGCANVSYEVKLQKDGSRRNIIHYWI